MSTTFALRSTEPRWMWMSNARYPAVVATTSSERPQKTRKAGMMPSRKRPTIDPDKHEQHSATPCRGLHAGCATARPSVAATGWRVTEWRPSAIVCRLGEGEHHLWVRPPAASRG